jgi:3-isopropylmalate/(R)-2-methylmalate dehydratase small subunit
MLKGKAWKFGDDVDTDVIIPARYLTSSDPDVLKQHCMEDLDPGFAGQVAAGDILVAGTNFGCGSSREHAPIAIKAAGISCVIARSFARIFFRNSFNIGLPILESPDAAKGIESGDEVEVDLSTGLIKNVSKGWEWQAAPVPEFMQELVADGGLIEHVKKLIAEGKVQKPDGGAVEEKKVEEKKPRGSRMKEIEQEAEPAGRAAPWVEEAPPKEGKIPGVPDDDEEEEEEEGQEK